MLADVAHLNAPFRIVIRGIGQAAALEALHQHEPQLAANQYVSPVWLGDRAALSRRRRFQRVARS